MNNMDELFPKFQKSIENLIEDEEGNIPGKKLLVLGRAYETFSVK